MNPRRTKKPETVFETAAVFGAIPLYDRYPGDRVAPARQSALQLAEDVEVRRRQRRRSPGRAGQLRCPPRDVPELPDPYSAGRDFDAANMPGERVNLARLRVRTERVWSSG